MKDRPRWARVRRWQTGAFILAAAGAWLASGPQANGQSSYFKKTRSDANVYVSPVASSIKKVAVLPFKAPTELIGSSVSDIFVTEMLRASRYTLVERGQIDRVLGETEFALSGLSESAAIEAGRMIGADGVILGTVDEYGMVAQRGRSYPVVGASIRLIDCDTGRVMWSVGHARRGTKRTDTLSGHARAVVHEMVSAVVQNWKVQRQVSNKYDDARGTRDNPDDWVGMTEEPSAPVRVETPPPPTPAPFTISDFGLREATLEWTPPSNRSLKYRVERAESLDGPFVPLETLSAGRGSYQDVGTKRVQLKDSSTYYYRLVAIGRDGQESGPTDAIESMTAPPPNPPTDVVAETPAGRAVSLEWAESTSDGVVEYLVERANAADEVFSQVGESSDIAYSEGGTAASTLRDSTAYLYRIRSVNRVGAVGEASEPIEVVTLPPPSAPSGLAADSLEVRCVPLYWDIHPEEDVVRYDVYRADSDAGPFTRLGSSSGLENTEYLDGGSDPGSLEDDRVYFYCIRAINGVTAESDYSETVMAATRPRPPVVEGLATITGLPRRVGLVWEESTDEKVIGYDVERSEDGGMPLVIARIDGRETVEYMDEGDESARFMRGTTRIPLKDGSSYSYRVCAVNTAEAVSDWCEPVEATTKIVPEIPTGLKATEGRARVIGMVWAANPEEDVAEYVVESSSFPNRNFLEVDRIAVDATRGIKQENLPPNLTRYYRVKAIDIDGLESDWSEPVAGSSKPLPEAPTELDVEWSSDGALISWTPPPQDDIVQYRILNKRFMGRDELAVSDEAVHFFPIEMLAKKKVLFVIAVDEDGLESPVSGTLVVRPPR